MAFAALREDIYGGGVCVWLHVCVCVWLHVCECVCVCVCVGFLVRLWFLAVLGCALLAWWGTSWLGLLFGVQDLRTRWCAIGSPAPSRAKR
jgi:hypothetical protein